MSRSTRDRSHSHATAATFDEDAKGVMSIDTPGGRRDRSLPDANPLLSMSRVHSPLARRNHRHDRQWRRHDAESRPVVRRLRHAAIPLASSPVLPARATARWGSCDPAPGPETGQAGRAVGRVPEAPCWATGLATNRGNLR